MRAALYLRQSQDRDATRAAVERQRDACQALLTERGWEQVAEFTDNDTSASSGKPRPGFLALLDAIRTGQVDAVVAWHPDRLYRHLRDLVPLIEEAEQGRVVLATVEVGHVDLSTPAGRMMATTLAGMARYEIEQKSARQRAAADQAAAAGRPRRGGVRPFGYGDDWRTPHPVEAPMVTAAYRALLDGEPLARIAAAWNAAGVTTTTGKAWTSAHVGNLLRRERNAGHLVHRGSIVGVGDWTPLIDIDTYDTAITLLSTEGRKPRRDTTRRHLGTGLYKCGRCSTPMKSGTDGTRNGGRVRIYRCPACQLSRRAEPLDAYVLDVAAARLSRPDAADCFPTGEEQRTIRADIATLRQRLDEAAALFTDGKITGEQLTRITTGLRSTIAEKEQRLATITTTPTLPHAATPEDARALLTGMLDNGKAREAAAVIDVLATITVLPVGPGRAPAPEDTCRIDWNG